MNLGLFLIPIVSGYLCITRLNPTRFYAPRYSGYHIFFTAAAAGVILAFAAHLIIFLASQFSNTSSIKELWHTFIPIPYSGTAVLTFLLAFVLPYIVNLFYDKERLARRMAMEEGNLIELLIRASINHQDLIELSLSSGKSYIGFALKGGITGQREADVALIPVASGYRDKDTRELKITTDYRSVVQEYCENTSNLEHKDFRIVVPMREIISARIFHPKVYKRFQEEG